ncbi:MAG: hypothetical protein BGO10_04105 [Chlamydia sp. 32-24]|nr:MAG: hypothetical protein BGO10_04105 [Chlamydia sp. 32-24]
MKLKIGVMGSASGPFPKTHKKIAFDLGCEIAQKDCVTITGACPGYPLEAARGAKSCGGLVVGVSPALCEKEHIEKYGSPTAYHDVLIYTGSGLMGREVINIRSSDIVVIIGGHSGTLGEFSIAYDEGNLIGVLTNTGGIAEEIEKIVKIVKKKTGSKVIYNSDPAILLNKLISYYKEQHYKCPDIHSKSFLKR